jgi:LPS export ABC transporter protein LptC
MPSARIYLLILTLAVGIGGCSSFRWITGRSNPSPAAEAPQEGLAFDNVTLRQTDNQGQLLWQIQAQKATYTKDQKVVRVRNIDGQLFQDGKVAFTIQAKQGEIYPEAETIRLTGDIIATEVREKTVLRGREVEWLPKADLLLVRRELQIQHPQAIASAQEARASSRNRTVEVQGQVVVNTRDPALRIQAHHALWRVAQQTITADPQVQVESLAQERGAERAVAAGAEINLNTKTVILGPKAQVSLTTPPLEVASPQLRWSLNQQRIESQEPVKVWHRQQEIVVTANRSNLDLAEQVVHLIGAVEANGLRNQATLKANELTWRIPTQAIEAEGNVRYQQEQPRMALQGPRATGKIQEQTIVLEGGQVVTEIFP